jgi:cellulose synthase/poly-beta-1,6-N-acetylglucosamine synthase-like glycosyltransferase
VYQQVSTLTELILLLLPVTLNILWLLASILLALTPLTTDLKARIREQVLNVEDTLISVIVPCYNEEAVIIRTIEQLLTSTWSNVEIIVVDDGSTDNTSQLVATSFGSCRHIRLIATPNRGKTHALNVGLDASRGVLLVTVDADTLLQPDTIYQLALKFSDPTVGAASGNPLVSNTDTFLGSLQLLEYIAFQNLERRASEKLGIMAVVPGAIGAWRVSCLHALGGFPTGTLAEDQDQTIALQRAGWRAVFACDAYAYTEVPETIRSLFRQRIRWSFGTVQCAAKHSWAIAPTPISRSGVMLVVYIWLIQILMIISASLGDVIGLWALMVTWVNSAVGTPTPSAGIILSLWLLYLTIDIGFACIAVRREKHAPPGLLGYIPIQRFLRRVFMGSVMIIALIRCAIRWDVVWIATSRRSTHGT